MTRQNLCAAALAVAAAWGISGAARATVFLTEPFNYPNGQLTAHNGGANVSGGVWTTHSPTPTQTPTTETVQVVDGKADVRVSGTEDVNTSTLSAQPTGGTWYYGARLTFNDLRTTPATIGSNYFLHLSDGGTTNFRGRLYVMPPNDTMSSQFTLGLSSSSVAAGNGAIVPWATDLSFGTDYTVVVSYTAPDADGGTTTDGYSSLWVNPASSASISITDTMPNTNVTNGTMSHMAMRQDGAGGAANNQPQALIDILAVGDNFDEVLAAVGGGGPTLDADFNNDTFVNSVDLTNYWAANYPLVSGAQNVQGDADGDQDVDGRDFLIWQQQLTPVIAAAVPEPGAVALAGCAVIGLLLRRRAA